MISNSTRKLCIVFLAGANSVHSYKWVKYFADKGHNVHWISFAENTQGEIKNVSFYQILKPFPFNFFKLKKIIKKVKPDIFHAHYAGVNGFLASLLNFHPFILTVWGSDVLIAGKHFMKKFFVKYALKKGDLITCDGENMKEAVIKMGIKENKIKIIYFGVDVEKFSSINEGKKSGNQIISLRNFEPIYNIETLVKAIPLVIKEIPDAKFVLAGKGSEEEKLKYLAKDLNVLENIKFVGWISQDELPEYLHESDIYVSTSLSDGGIASSTAEAMACGLPCIITDFGDNKEWIKNNESGFLIPMKDFNSLSEKIIYLLKNPKERLKFGDNARKIIVENSNQIKEMEKMEYIYLDIIKK